MRQNDAGDHGIPKLSDSPFLSPERRKVSRQPGCLRIENGNALIETVEDSLEYFR